jgi:hypothetical protein
MTLHIIWMLDVVQQPMLHSTASHSTMHSGDNGFSLESHGKDWASAMLLLPRGLRFSHVKVKSATLVLCDSRIVTPDATFDLADGAVLCIPQCTLTSLNLRCASSRPGGRLTTLAPLGALTCDDLIVKCESPAMLFNLVARKTVDAQLTHADATMHLGVSHFTRVTSTGVTAPSVHTLALHA